MVYVKWQVKDNAYGQLQTSASAAATSITLQSGHGARFPSFPGNDYICTLVQFDINGNVTQKERVQVTNRSGDVITITRGYDGDTALDFDANDYFYLYVTAVVVQDLQDEVTRLETDKLNKAGGTRTGLTAYRTLYTDSSGVEQQLTHGTSGYVLTSNGASANPSWQAPVDNSLALILGSGADGDLVVTSGTTSLTAGTIYNYNSISISVGATLNTSGNGNLLLKCLATCTISGTINMSGKVGTSLSNYLFGKLSAAVGASYGAGGNGGAGANGTGTGGAGGTAATGYGGGGGGGGSGIGAAHTGGAGGNGGTPVGTGGTGGAIGNNGTGGGTSAGGGGAGGNSDAGGNGGGGAYSTAGSAAGASSGSGGGSGGSVGAAGGSVVLYAKTYSGSGTITCAGTAGGNGGDGGNGGGGSSARGGGGGGGGGGAGGAIICVGAANTFGGTITVSAGAGGTGGAVGATGTGGSAGSNGSAGNNGNSVNVNAHSYLY